MTAAAPRRKPRRQVVLLRPVPGRTVMHDLWAGSKLLIVAAIGVLLTFYPGWVPIAAVGLLVVVSARIARIPRHMASKQVFDRRSAMIEGGPT